MLSSVASRTGSGQDFAPTSSIGIALAAGEGRCAVAAMLPTDAAESVVPTLVDVGGGADVPPRVVAMPWDGEGAWALVVEPDSLATSLQFAARCVPAGYRFVEAFGDVETVLVYRPAAAETAEIRRDEQSSDQSTSDVAGPGNVVSVVPSRNEGSTSSHPLALVRAARGWTYQTVANVVARRARLEGVNMASERQNAWRWEHLGVAPDRLTQRLLADELEVPRHMIELMPWPAWLPTVSRPSYDEVVAAITAEIEKGVQALAVLGYTVGAGAAIGCSWRGDTSTGGFRP